MSQQCKHAVQFFDLATSNSEAGPLCSVSHITSPLGEVDDEVFFSRMLRRRGFRPLLLAVAIILLIFLRRGSINQLFSVHDQKGVDFLWTSPENPLTTPPPSSQYLAYLPHSGFHNQRIELENAIVLSIILNRTLVLPLVRLGANPLPYKPFDELLEKYSRSDKSRLFHCHTEDTAANSTVKECRKFERYTHISWQDIVDVSLLKVLGLFFVERWNFRQTWLRDTLRLRPNDTYWFKDSNAYEMQFYDETYDETRHEKYMRRVNISELRDMTRTYPLLHLGTLFGSSRLRLSIRDHKLLQAKVRSALALANPFLNRLSEQIVNKLGGHDTYYSIHLRVEDSMFAENAVGNAQVVLRTLLSRVHGLSDEVIASLRLTTSNIAPLSQHLLTLPRFNKTLRSANPQPCNIKGATSARLATLSTTLFVATDAKSHMHPALQPFLSLHPCLFFISDFPQARAELAQVVNPLDDSPMERFLLPFLDSMVAAHSAAFIGTPESTFSKYIEDVLWPRYHN